MKKNIALSVVTAMTLAFVGCGGGGGGNSSSSTSSSTSSLQDSTVSGINYTCSSNSQTLKLTNSNGDFTCPNSDMVDFSVGGVKIGSYLMQPNKSKVYLAELFDLSKSGWGDDRLSLALQFLQSIDSDNNASNGIDISDTTRTNLAGANIDIYGDSNTTSAESQLSTFLTNNLGIALKDKNLAIEHYKSTLMANSITPKETYRDSQWYINDKDSASIVYNHPNVLNNYTGKGVTICVIDSHVNINHEDLNVSTTVGNSDNVSNYHGTWTTGVINAQINGKGIRGIAPDAKIVFLSELQADNDLFTQIVDNNCSVVNKSYGSSDNNNTLFPSDAGSFVSLATNERGGKGIVFVQSAGNDNTNTYFDENLSKYEIVVGASNAYNLKASFSNYGSDVDVIASGESIYTTSLDGGYQYVNGTSFSAPIVSGLVALMLEANPNLTSLQIQDIIKKSADKIGDDAYVNDGVGIGTRNNNYGYGKVNVFGAIEMAKGM